MQPVAIRFWLVALLLCAASATASQPTVVITRSESVDLGASLSPARSGSGSGVGSTSAGSSNEPSSSLWIVPFIVDTGNPVGATTLFSVTNELDISLVAGGNNAALEYHDALGVEFHDEAFALGLGDLRSFNVRDQPGLPAGRAVGFVEIHSMLGNRPSVDYFQVTPDQDFATGGLGIQTTDFCDRWRARVLVGGPFDGVTSLLFIVNGPLGADPADPPTVLGSAYDEDGNKVDEFLIRTDGWVFEVDAEDLVGPSLFGYLELRIESEFGDPSGGYVIVNSGAEGRYSAGMSGICRDSLPVVLSDAPNMVP